MHWIFLMIDHIRILMNGAYAMMNYCQLIFMITRVVKSAWEKSFAISFLCIWHIMGSLNLFLVSIVSYLDYEYSWNIALLNLWIQSFLSDLSFVLKSKGALL